MNILQTESDTQKYFYKRNLPHYYQPGACYFITFRLAGSLPIKIVRKLKEEYEFPKQIIGRSLKNKKELEQQLSDSWKRYCWEIDKLLREYKKSPKYLGRMGAFWQDESYDHIVGYEKELERIIYYVLNNPVKAGLVNNCEKWEWNYLGEINL
ncbi:MAG: hypothetical protein DRP89_01765 [Candidatus Neomarinimicrobiota bacterium]|nr:MAG: hypothetical protein DRP89_01765 [Candidatus Neomarinimicrobiota bacterium]